MHDMRSSNGCECPYKALNSLFLIISLSGNRVLTGLNMKRPSAYLEQWTDKNAQWYLLVDIKEHFQVNDVSQ